MASKRVPPEYSDIQLMQLTGWSWDELQNTPIDVAQRTQVYLLVKHAKESGVEVDIED